MKLKTKFLNLYIIEDHLRCGDLIHMILMYRIMNDDLNINTAIQILLKETNTLHDADLRHADDDIILKSILESIL